MSTPVPSSCLQQPLSHTQVAASTQHRPCFHHARASPKQLLHWGHIWRERHIWKKTPACSRCSWSREQPYPHAPGSEGPEPPSCPYLHGSCPTCTAPAPPARLLWNPVLFPRVGITGWDHHSAWCLSQAQRKEKFCFSCFHQHSTGEDGAFPPPSSRLCRSLIRIWEVAQIPTKPRRSPEPGRGSSPARAGVG